MRFRLDQQLVFFFQFRRLHLLQVFFQPLQPLLDLAKIADHQVELDILDVAQRVDRPDVRNGIVFKRPQHVDQRVHLRRWPM